MTRRVLPLAAAALIALTTICCANAPAATTSGGTGAGIERGRAHQGVAPAADQGDLCGGTGGIGQIVSVGKNEFTITRNDDRDQIVHLGTRATVETSHGYASVSDLTTGDRVTLVGDENRDGSFSADAVVVCNGTQATGTRGSGTTQATPHVARKANTNYQHVSRVIDVATMFLLGSIWLGLVAFLRLRKRKSLVYVLLFTVFYAYLYKVLDYTLIQFQSLILVQHFVPDLMLNGLPAGTSVNLVPLATLTVADAKTSLLNVLMMLPFGFGLPFITNLRGKRVVAAGAFFSAGIEVLQLITGLTADTTFRIADINDVVFNTLGVTVGYLLCVAFARLYRRAFHNWPTMTDPLLRCIGERPQVGSMETADQSL